MWKYGNIDLLVNAVGSSTIVEDPSIPIDAMSFEDWKKLLDFNLDATFLFSNAVIPGMKTAGGGKIVNLASIAGRGERFQQFGLCNGEGGIIALTRKLSLELGQYGINVNAIAPSLTLTERLMPHGKNGASKARQRKSKVR